MSGGTASAGSTPPDMRAALICAVVAAAAGADSGADDTVAGASAGTPNARSPNEFQRGIYRGYFRMVDDPRRNQMES